MKLIRGKTAPVGVLHQEGLAKLPQRYGGITDRLDCRPKDCQITAPRVRRSLPAVSSIWARDWSSILSPLSHKRSHVFSSVVSIQTSTWICMAHPRLRGFGGASRRNGVPHPKSHGSTIPIENAARPIKGSWAFEDNQVLPEGSISRACVYQTLKSGWPSSNADS